MQVPNVVVAICVKSPNQKKDLFSYIINIKKGS